MNDQKTKELKVRGKQEISGSSEQTRPGLVFTPDVDILETDLSLTLLADMPGVMSDSLSVDLRDDTITITGRVQPSRNEKENPLVIEYETGTYYRQFSLSEIIDQEKIDAQLKNGVLRLTLPKVAKTVPRKIVVNTD